MHNYIGFYKDKQYETQSDSTYHAQQKIAAEHGIKDKDRYKISVFLNDKDTVHVAVD